MKTKNLMNKLYELAVNPYNNQDIKMVENNHSECAKAYLVWQNNS